MKKNKNFIYQVIILLNNNGRSYYQSYVRSDDTALGNISTDVLPPTQDILQAQSYWWDFDTETWMYDEDMYYRLLTEEEKEISEAEQREKERKSQPTIEEISEALIELAEIVSELRR